MESFEENLSSHTLLQSGKSQEEIVKVLLNSPQRRHGALSSYLKRHGLVASALSNLRKPNLDQLKELGFKDQTITNEEGYKTRILVRISKDPRPMLVFLAGTGLSVDMEAFTDFALPIALSTQWNVALIENFTSGEWIHRNRKHKRVIATGYEAGWDLYLTLKAMRSNPKLKDAISELHLIGLSLGGNDCVFAAYFDSKQGNRVIDGSVMAWSAPPDRFRGFHDFRTLKGLSGVFVSMLLKDIYQKGQSVFTSYSSKSFEWVLDPKVDTLSVLREIYFASAKNYFTQYPHHFSQENLRHKTSADILESELSFSDFLGLFVLDAFLPKIQKPVLWVHAQDDPIVSFVTTREYLQRFKNNSGLGFLPLKHGGHLGFSTSYGVDWLREAIINYVAYWGRFERSHYLQWV